MISYLLERSKHGLYLISCNMPRKAAVKDVRQRKPTKRILRQAASNRARRSQQSSSPKDRDHPWSAGRAAEWGGSLQDRLLVFASGVVVVVGGGGGGGVVGLVVGLVVVAAAVVLIVVVVVLNGFLLFVCWLFAYGSCWLDYVGLCFFGFWSGVCRSSVALIKL